jgi:peptide deformylase
MSVRPIIFFPESVLRKPCRPVTHFDPALKKMLIDLEETMRKQPHGIGIAAPQIGIPVQAALVDVSARVPGAGLLRIINPQILELRHERASREGCMSLPDYTANIKRYDWILLSWQDETGTVHQREFAGIEAVCIQHEVDHLHGMLFIDRVISLKRDMIPRPKESKKP